jgi:hypothetical protein
VCGGTKGLYCRRWAAAEALRAVWSPPPALPPQALPAGSRPGGRPTFLFAQESRQRSAPRLPALRRWARQSLARSRGARPINWPCETPRSPLAAEGPPGRSLNSLLALRAWIPLRGTASDNATQLPPANLPRSAGQRGRRIVAHGGWRLKQVRIGQYPPFKLRIRILVRRPLSILLLPFEFEEERGHFPCKRLQTHQQQSGVREILAMNFLLTIVVCH